MSAANNQPDWKATVHSHICSKHFSCDQDYIIPPSHDGTCRLKHNAVPTIFHQTTCSNYGISRMVRRHMENPLDPQQMTTAEKVGHDHTYCKKSEPGEDTCTQRSDLEDKLKRKIKSLQQQLRRTKAKQETMNDIINELQQKSILTTDDAENMHAQFDEIQLSIFRDTKNNVSCLPNGRRYSDVVKEFAMTLHYYSPKAYEYVRTILPLPHESLIKKWSSVVECQPGFIRESFESLQQDIAKSPEKKDCFLIIDAMSTRKQILYDSTQDKYVGFVNYGAIQTEKPDTLASEAVVFLLVGARTHWKCPIGYFLADKMSSRTQAKLVQLALEKAAEAGLRVWSVTTDGTSVNIGMFTELGCNFTTSFDSMVTKFKHPTENYYVYAVLDPCHMLKLARNALASLTSFVDKEKNLITWNLLQALNTIQSSEGFTMANKFSTKHLKFEKHKMNVQLAAQTLSSSVADAIEFLASSQEYKNKFPNSKGTIKFIRIIDQLFDILNSRNPVGKGFKQPLRPESKETWEEILTSTAQYLLSLRTNSQVSQLLSTHGRKTFVIGFVMTIKSTIAMASEMFTMENPFKYLLTYKFSQDHIEILFSCIRARGGWNNNPNCLQLKYAIRKMLLRNAVSASKNGNCLAFTNDSTTIIPFFHSKKHNAPLTETPPDNCNQTIPEFLSTQLINPTSEFLSNVLFYIGGFVVSKLLDKLTCLSCKKCLLSQFTSTVPDHDYCAMNYSDVTSASAFTVFVNNGGLKIPSRSVYLVVEYAEKVFKCRVCKDGDQISREARLKQKLILDVCNHFIMDTKQDIFEDHELGVNESVFEEDHRSALIKLVADKYLTLRIFTYGKRYQESVVTKGQPSDRHKLTKSILFKNQ